MHSTQFNTRWNRMALVALSTAMFLTSGCARVYHFTHYNALGYYAADRHRPYYQSPHTGRIIAKEHGHFCPTEPPCFGFEPTCWTSWPAECPQQCNQPCLADGSIVVEEVVHPAPAVVTPAEMPEAEAVESAVPEEAPLEEERELETPPGVLLEPASPSDRPLLNDPDMELPMDVTPPPLDAAPSTILDVVPEDDTSFRFSPPPLEAEATETVTAPPVEKQPLDDQMIEQLELPTTTEATPMAVWDARVPRRQVDQRMVLVDGTSAAREPFIDRVPTLELPATTVDETTDMFAISPVTSPVLPVEEPQPERFAIASDPVDRVPQSVTSPEDLPATDFLPKAELQASPPLVVEDAAPTTTLQLVDVQPGPAMIPSFKITAVPPPRSRIVESSEIVPIRVTTGATIRFTTEEASSAPLGTAKKPSRETSTSLRFR